MSLPLASTEFLRTLVPFGSKLPDSEEDRGVVAHFLGIPVGFQFGTAAGLTGIPALVTDILTDPTTYLLGGLGGLTKLGRGAVAGAKVLKGFQVAEEAAGVTEKLVPLVRRGIEAGGKTWQETRNLLREPMKLAFQTETQGFRNVHSVVNGLDTNLARKALNEIRSGTTLAGEIRPGADEIRRMVAALEISGPEGLSAHLTGSIGKREQMRTLLDQVLSAPDFATAKGLLKELRGIAPTEAYKNLFSPGMSRYWKQAFEAEKAGLPISAVAEGARAQVKAGQRALVNLKVPFGPEAALVKGEGIVGGVAEAFGKAGKKLGVNREVAAGAAAAAASKPLERLRLTPTALHDTMLAGADEIAKSTAEVLNSGNLSLQGEELLKNRAVLRAQHTRVAEQAGAATEGVFQDIMKEMGLNTPQDYEKVNELLQNPAKILKRPSVQRGNVKITQRLAEGAFGRTDIFGELPAGYTEGHVMVAQAIRSGMQRYAQIATKSGVLGSVIKDYAARVHTILKPEEFRKAMGALSTETTTFWKHAQERLLQGWDEVLALEKRGVLTTEKNPGKLLAGYITSLGKVTADAGLMDGLALDRIPLEVTKKTGKTKDYLLHMMLPGDARFDRYANFTGKYVRVTNADSPSIMTLAQQMGERTGLKGFGYTRHIWVHEDIAKNLRAVIEPGFANPSHLPATATGADKALSTALQINSVAKRALLAPGTVHLVNLTMKSLITNGWDGFVSTMGKTLPDFIKTPNSRSYLENIPDLLDAARHDLVLSAPSDAERDTFQKALRWVSDKLPVSKPVVDAVRNMEGWASGKLWNQYHSPLKLYTYNEILSRTAAKFPELDPAALKRTIAAHVNKSFGGGNLEAFVGSKKGQQLLRLMFISPDWLIGNTKIATDVLAGISLKPGQILPAGAVLANDARAFFARQYALRAGLMMVFAGNFANLAFTGHFMHDNEDASKIQLPGSDSNGRPIYLGMFDPFLFPFELASKPFEFLRRKFGPVPRAVIGEALGRDFYGAPIVTAKDGPLSNLMKRIGFAAEQAAPISLQTTLGLQQGNIPAGVRALGLLGLPIRGSPHSAEQINETVPAAHPTKTKQELRAEVQAEMQAQIEKTVARFGEAHSLMMKSDGYRRGLDRQRDGLAVVPTDAMLAVAR